MSLRIRLRGDRLWVCDSRCRPAEPGPLQERVLGAHTIVFPRSGVFVRHKGQERHVGDPNHVLFFNPDEPYRSSHPGGHGDDCDLLTVREDVLKRIVSRRDPAAESRPGRVFAIASVATSPRLALLQRLVFAALPGATGETAAAEDAVVRVLEALIEESYGVPRDAALFPVDTMRQHREWVECVMSLLASQFQRGPSLAEASDAAGCSPFHLCRVFKRHTGLSIHRYLNRLRLRTALDRVLDASTHLAELADALGYSSHSHFTDAFRREFGVTPTLVRRVAGTVPIGELGRLAGTDEPLGAAFKRLTAPPPAVADSSGAPPPKPAVPQPEPLTFRGEPLDPRPYIMPRVPLQPHAA